MTDRIKYTLGKYADPRYIKWVLILLGLIGLVLGAGAPEDFGGVGPG